ncbi:MAG: hypothetical protein M1821_005563 [Bathelium mastoideum]|nr:MAG: hypothetical protein M1821_005563 [Bathelium mastoideum]
MSALRNKIAEPLLRHGLLTRDGEAWKKSRSIIMPIFAKTQIVDLYSLEIHLQSMIKLLPSNGSTVDLMPLFKRLFIDKGTEFILGQSISSLNAERAHPDIESFMALYDNVLRGMGARLRLGHFRFIRGFDRQWKNDCKKIHITVEGFVNKAAESRTKSVHRSTLVDKLLEVTQDRAQITTMLVNVFLAGRDQTGIAISHVFFLLARHPRVWTKLRHEVLAVEPPFTYERIKSCNYLQCVLLEAFRLESPVGRVIRHCVSPCILPHGGGKDGKAPTLVQPGTQVEVDFSAMHHDPFIWGKDSNDFLPERWQGRKIDWEYIPFLAAPRYCPAKDMVMIQCAYVLFRMVQEFTTLENRDETWELVEDLRNVKQSRRGALVALFN